MKERELLEKIKNSAEETEIPDKLLPEEIKRYIGKKQEKESKFSMARYAKVAAAVILLFFCSYGIFSVVNLTISMQSNMQNQQSLSDGENTLDKSVLDEELAEIQETGRETGGGEQSVKGNKIEKDVNIPRKNAGDMYLVAGSYEEAYEIIRKSQPSYIYNYDREDVEREEIAGAADGAVPQMDEQATSMSDIAQIVDLGNTSYSKTNLQTEGVDESDIVKTDGAYIYSVSNNRIKITDIRNGVLEAAGTISMKWNSASSLIKEMYVDGDRLIVIAEQQITIMEQVGSSYQESSMMRDTYYINTQSETIIYLYDISDRKNPVLLGEVRQDGGYYTSRKIGDIIYLFSQKYFSIKEGISTDKESWVPRVNGEKIATDCIYIPAAGETGLIISSINVNGSGDVVDNVMILNNSVNIYVSNEALYLYNSNYSAYREVTEIAKFQLLEGRINAVGASSVPGVVYDTFAINEYRGRLRLLTTVWNAGGKESNSLYLFDGNMEMTGKLEGIAEGERIYAAKFLKDMAYFVTYRNTDPLFAVDLSDVENPEILGELKITGFSEYLHFWGEDKLLGVGYETDPNTGERKGIKLVMFDISNPGELTTLGTYIMKNADYSPALDRYKCVLAEEKENIIGFATISYGKKYSGCYHVFSWENGKFINLFNETLPENTYAEDFRGIYAGSIFYLVGLDEISSYDRENTYKLLKTLNLTDK